MTPTVDALFPWIMVRAWLESCGWKFDAKNSSIPSMAKFKDSMVKDNIHLYNDQWTVVDAILAEAATLAKIGRHPVAPRQVAEAAMRLSQYAWERGWGAL